MKNVGSRLTDGLKLIRKMEVRMTECRSGLGKRQLPSVNYGQEK